MNFSALFKVLGMVVLFLGSGMVIPLIGALVFGAPGAGAFAASLVIALTAGGAMSYRYWHHDAPFRRREAFAVVSLGWVLGALFGCLPFLFSGTFAYPGTNFFDQFVNCYFETMSGFTTTGASVMTDIESQPGPILFWRSMTHFYGGIGIIVLFVAVLPFLGVGGRELFFTEAPGPIAEGLKPKIAQTARTVVTIYLSLNVIQAFLLKFGGMSWFDAWCHAFGTMATGGFSTKNASIAHFNSVYVDVVITIFMFLAGANFALFYQAIRGNGRAMYRDAEFRAYSLIIGLGILATTFDLWLRGTYDSLATALRYGSFQVVCMITTTGFATADFDTWPAFCKLLLVFYMFIGGSSGSTGGGMKVIRIAVVFKHAIQEIMHSFRPHKVSVLRLGSRVIDDSVRANIIGFFVLHLIIFSISSIIMGLVEGMDVVSAPTSVIACLMNIGPGLGAVGPTQNFAWIPTSGKLLLSFLMLLGRLELYAVMVLFLPSFWQKA